MENGTIFGPSEPCTGKPRRSGLASVLSYRGGDAEAGGALLEFALMLPILAMIMMGILTFGVVVNNYLQLCDAVNVGAKQLAVSRGNDILAPDPCAMIATTFANAAPGLTQASLSITITINTTVYTGSSCTAAFTTFQNSKGDSVKLEATYPCTLNIAGSSALPCGLYAQTTEYIQ